MRKQVEAKRLKFQIFYRFGFYQKFLKLFRKFLGLIKATWNAASTLLDAIKQTSHSTIISSNIYNLTKKSKHAIWPVP